MVKKHIIIADETNIKLYNKAKGKAISENVAVGNLSDENFIVHLCKNYLS